ncbi:MAG TPA: toprim domain-containing protein [Candidatus Norongarragalinales archaeon]|nr:toprim domain-containing protein [Candidatus Norongarragalinales archaeon]
MNGKKNPTVHNRAAEAEKALSLLRGKAVLVEGAHDRNALKSLGIEATIAFEPSWRFVERHQESLRKKEVVLLFDFDAEGIRKTHAFTEALFGAGITPRQELRSRVRSLFGVRTVEEIPARLEKIQTKGETHGKNLRGHGQIPDQGQLRSRRHR